VVVAVMFYEIRLIKSLKLTRRISIQKIFRNTFVEWLAG
jgi:hypothetical protein